MASAITNEGEHRRGLVLGLTLAEILLLLLFLILLALGDRLIKDENNLQVAEDKLKAATAFFDQLKNSGQFGKADAQQLLAELAKVQSLEETVKKLREENARAKSQLTAMGQKSGTLDNIIAGANSIDPNDSPAILKFGWDTLGALGRNVDPEKIKALSDLGSILDNTPKSERGKLAGEFKEFVASGGKTSGHTWPPIIRLNDADYRFTIGSAELTPEFEKKIRQKIVLELLSTASEYKVDVIEVVGHTDELSIAQRYSNLDEKLVPALRGDTDAKTLIPGDNAGLGLARAVAVVDVLKKDERLKRFRVLPLSGAQLIQNNETLSTGIKSGDDPDRRRIEIRMRKYIPAKSPG